MLSFVNHEIFYICFEFPIFVGGQSGLKYLTCDRMPLSEDFYSMALERQLLGWSVPKMGTYVACTGWHPLDLGRVLS